MQIKLTIYANKKSLNRRINLTAYIALIRADRIQATFNFEPCSVSTVGLLIL